MAALPKEAHDRITFHLNQIKGCFKEAHVTVVVRCPWLEESGQDGNCVMTDDPDLLEVIRAVEERIIEKELPEIKKKAAKS